jgi:hypothetical protein
VSGDEAGLPAPPVDLEMIEAAHRLTLEVTEAVFLSDAGQPARHVLAVLMLAAETPLFIAKAATLLPAAHAISRGQRFVFI